MTLNGERIRTLITEARRASLTLASFQNLTREQFLQDTSAIERVRYNFIMMIQSCIDIANHITARRGNRAPSTYAESFKIMQEIGIIDTTISQNMQRLSGLRNVLVHLYWQIDDTWESPPDSGRAGIPSGKVYDSLQQDLPTIEQFLSTISRIK